MNYTEIGYKTGLLCLVLASVLGGCIGTSKSPQARFYALQAIDKSQVDKKFDVPSTVIIGIGPVKVPEYLNRPQIVTENDKNLLTFAEFDRWGEPLDFALPRLISVNLSFLLPAATIETSPWNISVPVRYQVIIDVVRLESRLDKDLSLTAQWSVIDLDSRKILITKRSEFNKPIDPHDYSGLAMTLSAECATLSSEIAESLSSLAAVAAQSNKAASGITSNQP